MNNSFKNHDFIHYRLRNSHPCCIVVFWSSYVDTVVIATARLISPFWKTKGHDFLHSVGDPFVSISKDQLVTGIIDEWKANNGNIAERHQFVQTCVDLLDPVLLRQQNLEKYGHCQNLEATTTSYIASVLSSHGYYSPTPAATCSADSLFRLLQAAPLRNLAFQHKVGNEQLSGRYSFNRCNDYPGMIIICRPLPRDSPPESFIVIPNAIAPKQVNQSFQNAASPLNKLIVPQTEFAQLIVDIFKARQEGIDTIKYPSGHDVDISDIRFFSEDELNTPTSAKCKKEHENTKARERRFPDLEYVYPTFQETFDVRINGVKSQDKCGEEKNDYHAVKIVKNAGNTEGSKRNKGPYEAGDFDVLWANLPGGEGIFMIPAWEMDEHGYFKSATCSGNQWISCFKPGYVPHKRFAGRMDLWTSKYYVSYDDPLVQDKVIEILNRCKSRS